MFSFRGRTDFARRPRITCDNGPKKRLPDERDSMPPPPGPAPASKKQEVLIKALGGKKTPGQSYSPHSPAAPRHQRVALTSRRRLTPNRSHASRVVTNCVANRTRTLRLTGFGHLTPAPPPTFLISTCGCAHVFSAGFHIRHLLWLGRAPWAFQTCSRTCKAGPRAAWVWPFAQRHMCAVARPCQHHLRRRFSLSVHLAFAPNSSPHLLTAGKFMVPVPHSCINHKV